MGGGRWVVFVVALQSERVHCCEQDDVLVESTDKYFMKKQRNCRGTLGIDIYMLVASFWCSRKRPNVLTFAIRRRIVV
jgi:hypothetical protein